MSVDIVESRSGHGASGLDELRRRLDDLAMRRRLALLFDFVLLAAALAVSCAFIYYRLDRWLTLELAARAFLDVVACALLLMLVWRRLRPVLFRRDDAIGTALGIERRRGIDVDLTAALQFDRALRTGRGEVYGSSQLAAAVVERGSLLGMQIDPADEPVPHQPAWSRVAYALLPAAALVWAVWWPGHFFAFADRILLGDASYPSNTRIAKVTINGRQLDFPERRPGAVQQPPEIVVLLNSSVELLIETSGEIVKSATVEIEVSPDELIPIELKSAHSSKVKFAGSFAALTGKTVCRFKAGDGAAELVVIARPLPIVAATPIPIPPDYARHATIPLPARGALTAEVLAGSDVTIEIECANKSLQAVTMRLTERADRSPSSKTSGPAKAYDVLLRTDDPERRVWRADPATPVVEVRSNAFAASFSRLFLTDSLERLFVGSRSVESPLQQIAAAFDYTITAVDDDGFSPAESLSGSLTIRDDGPPGVSAKMVTKFVLPTGKPKIDYWATDDIGIHSLSIARHVARIDGTATESPVPIPPTDDADRTAISGQFSLQLADLQLHKGDRVTVTVEARDRNGGATVAASRSESFTLEVTDEQGIYEAMAKTDQSSAIKMDEIIAKQKLITRHGSSMPTQGEPPPTLPPTLPLVSPSSTVPAPTATAVPSATTVPFPRSTGTSP